MGVCYMKLQGSVLIIFSMCKNIWYTLSCRPCRGQIASKPSRPFNTTLILQCQWFFDQYSDLLYILLYLTIIIIVTFIRHRVVFKLATVTCGTRQSGVPAYHRTSSLFVIVMEVIPRDCTDALPQELLYADDLVIIYLMILAMLCKSVLHQIRLERSLVVKLSCHSQLIG